MTGCTSKTARSPSRDLAGECLHRIKKGWLDGFGAPLPQAGFVVLLHDHRSFRASDGEPRCPADARILHNPYRGRAFLRLLVGSLAGVSSARCADGAQSIPDQLYPGATTPRLRRVVRVGLDCTVHGWSLSGAAGRGNLSPINDGKFCTNFEEVVSRAMQWIKVPENDATISESTLSWATSSNGSPSVTMSPGFLCQCDRVAQVMFAPQQREREVARCRGVCHATTSRVARTMLSTSMP